MDSDQTSRRDFLGAVGWLATCAGFAGMLAATGRYLVPNVLYEPPHAYKIGRPEDYPEGVNYVAQKRLFVLREHGLIRAVSAVCTHIGCTINWAEDHNRWECPCHGSIFNLEGHVISGPAPRPLPWYEVALAPDGRLFVDQDVVVSSQKALSV